MFLFSLYYTFLERNMFHQILLEHHFQVLHLIILISGDFLIDHAFIHL